ncbi:hypothetical protein [Desulfovermiculus halophilus]|uniref:hypothetical protein n=1 Tax=Desulfovermiculus halophilus TaxID=339722 RepID=UPI0012947872|nr:hypothetical protein [Desulfovermiculus halophilus]
MQTALLMLICAIAAGYLALRLYRTMKVESGGCCGCCICREAPAAEEEHNRDSICN